ncbi:MAG: hypothetical protein H0U75_13010 [Legionella sp.]|nr:hypothetical protein [Legionella sp.]
MSKQKTCNKSKEHSSKKSNLHNILYFDAIVGNDALLDKYAKTIEQLVDGQYAKANLEKLQGHDIFSIRVNQQDRLLFVKVTFRGKSYFVLLEEVLNHDYDKSRFLKPHVLKAYRENKTENIIEQAIAFESCQGTLLNKDDIPAESPSVPHRISFYNTFYIPSEEQDQAVYSKKTSVVFGPPGSGKSGAALDLLVRIALKASKSSPLKLLFVAQSSILVKEMAEKFRNHPLIQDLKQNEYARVAFNTPAQLCGIPDEPPETKDELKSISRTLSATERTAYVKTWLQEYRRKLKNRDKAKNGLIARLKNDILKDADCVYEEFRIIAPFYSTHQKNEYMKLGFKQSGITDLETRDILYAAFEAYVKSNSHSEYDIALVLPPEWEAEEFHMVVVDEAQDLSPLQLRWFKEKSKLRQIRYFCSHDQSYCTIFNRQSFTTFLPDCDIDFIQFSESFRSPSVVTTLVKRAILAKIKISGNSDKLENHPLDMAINSKPGILEWINPTSLPEDFYIDSETPVLCREEDTLAASILFNTKFVCTPLTFKGRERKRVVVFNILDGETVREICNLLQSTDVEPSGHRAKVSLNGNYDKAINEFIIAITRGTEHVIIAQEMWHWLTPLMKILQPQLEEKSQTEKAVFVAPVSEQKPTDENWLLSAKKLFLDDGLVAQSKAIFCETLGKSEAEFEDYCLTWKRQGITSTYTFAGLSQVPNKNKPLPKVMAEVELQPDVRTTPKRVGQVKVLSPSSLLKFADRLHQKFTEENLQIIFQDPNFANLFFGEYVIDGQTMTILDTILCTNNKLRQFISFLHKNPNHLALLSGTILSSTLEKDRSSNTTSPLFLMMVSPLGFSLFKILLRIPTFRSQISADILYKTSKLPLQYEGLSVFLCLSMLAENCSILLDWFNKNPKLLQEMPIEALIQPAAKYTEDNLIGGLTHLHFLDSHTGSNATAFYYLSMSSEGIKVIQKIFEKRPDFIQERLIHALMIQTNALGKESSAWDHLYKSPKGPSILQLISPDSLIVHKEPEIAETIAVAIAPKALGIEKDTEELVPLESEITDLSAFIVYLLEDFSFKTLKYLFAHKYFNFLLFEMKDDTLNEILDCEKHLQIFAEFILDENNLNEAKHLTAKRMCKNDGPNMPPVYQFASRSYGCKILQYLQSINDDFLITEEAFFQLDVDGYSTFHILCAHDRGPVILKDIFEKNPSLSSKITLNRLTTRAESVDKRLEKKFLQNSSIIFWLTQVPQGLQILANILIKNKKLMLELTIDEVCDPSILDRYDKDKIPVESWVLFQLATSKEGCALLKIILTLKDNNLLLNFPTRALITQASGDKLGVTVLDILCTHPPGVDILRIINGMNFMMVNGIPPKAWPRCFNKEHLKPSNIPLGVKFFSESQNTPQAQEPLIQAYRNKICDEFSSLHIHNILRQPTVAQKVFTPVFFNQLIMIPSLRTRLMKFLMDPENSQDAKYFSADFLSKQVATSAGDMPLLFVLLNNPQPDSQLLLGFNHLVKERKHFKISADTLYKKNTLGHSLFLLIAIHALEALFILFNVNEQLYAEMTGADLYHITSKYGLYEHKSVLSFLSNTQRGCALLEKIFEKNPGLFTGFNVMALFDNLKMEKHGDSKSNTILQQLASTRFGRKILVFLFVKNPSLFEKIPYQAWIDNATDAILPYSARYYIRRSSSKELIEFISSQDAMYGNTQILSTDTDLDKEGQKDPTLSSPSSI